MTASAKAVMLGILGMLLFSGQSLFLMKSNSTVSDEVAHITSGYTYLKMGTLKLNPEHPPLAKQLGAIPLLFMNLKFPTTPLKEWTEVNQWDFGRAFLFSLGNPAEKIIFSARLALLPLGFILGLVLFLWARDQWGDPAAAFAVLAMAATPDLLAHASLVNTDFAAAVFFITCIYLLDQYDRRGTFKWLLGAGLTGGLALCSKFSMILLLPLFYLYSVLSVTAAFAPRVPTTLPKPSWLFLTGATVVTVFHRFSAEVLALPLLSQWVKPWAERIPLMRRKEVQRALTVLFWLTVSALLVIALIYFEKEFWFDKFRPFKRYFRGLSIFQDHAVEKQHPGFFFGELSRQGWKHYFVTALFVKIPLALQIFFWTGVLRAFFRPMPWRRLFFLTIPPLFFLFIASFVNKVNIGVRHVLPVYPFLILFAASGFQGLWSRPGTRVGALALAVWLAVSSGAAFPNYLSYFNEAAGMWGGGDRILGDSNIAWGQDAMRLRDYVLKNRIDPIKTVIYFNSAEELRYYGIPFEPGDVDFQAGRPGLYAVDVFSLQSLRARGEFEDRLHPGPVDRIGGSLLIYNFKAKDV